jgi:hypothetical protein
MNRNPQYRNTNRRNFLMGLAAASGLVAGAGAVKASNEEGVAEPPGNAPHPRGYRLTPHVAKYYGKARF